MPIIAGSGSAAASRSSAQVQPEAEESKSLLRTECAGPDGSSSSRSSAGVSTSRRSLASSWARVAAVVASAGAAVAIGSHFCSRVSVRLSSGALENSATELLLVEPEETPLAWRDRSQRCLTLQGKIAVAGVSVVLMPCREASPEQDFTLNSGQLRMQAHPDLCVTKGSSTPAGAELTLESCSEHNQNQAWVVNSGFIHLAFDVSQCVSDMTLSGRPALVRLCPTASPDPSRAHHLPQHSLHGSPQHSPQHHAEVPTHATVHLYPHKNATKEDGGNELRWHDAHNNCLSVPQRDVGEGDVILLVTCDASAEEQRFLYSQGMIQYKRNLGLCVSAAAPTRAGFGLILYHCDRYDQHQLWFVKEDKIALAFDLDKCIAGVSRSGTPAVAQPCSQIVTTTHAPSVSHAVAAASSAAADPDGTCSKPGEDCTHTGHCCMQGLQCYSKSQFYSACLADCDPAWGWTCKTIGTRTPQVTPGSWAGDDCTSTQSCNGDSNQCVKKDYKSAYCVPKDQTPDGWDGTVIGGARGEYWINSASEGELVAGTTLFCWMAVLPSSYEEPLEAQARRTGAGIFQCDEHKVYEAQESNWVSQGTWQSYANTEQFIKVWEDVFKGTEYTQNDWTVKVDPDTVFLPWRLKEKLANLRPPANKPIYIKNCAVFNGFLGAIEVVSKVAVHNLKDGIYDCARTMPGRSGEDGWLKGCLDGVGAGYMTDVEVLKSPNDPKCTDGDRVAFHPHKEPEDWASCWSQATR